MNINMNKFEYLIVNNNTVTNLEKRQLNGVEKYKFWGIILSKDCNSEKDYTQNE